MSTPWRKGGFSDPVDRKAAPVDKKTAPVFGGKRGWGRGSVRRVSVRRAFVGKYCKNITKT